MVVETEIARVELSLRDHVISSKELKLEYANIPKAQRTTCRLKNFGNEIAQRIMNKFIVNPCKRSNIFHKSVKKLKLK